MENSDLEAERGNGSDLLADLKSVQANVVGQLFGADELRLSDRARSTILSLMDSLITQCHHKLFGDGRVSEPELSDDLQAIFAEPGLIFFLLCRYFEWQLAGWNGPQPISSAMTAALKNDDAAKPLIMQTISANARFAYNMEQMDIALDEVPADLIHHLMRGIATGHGKALDGKAAASLMPDEAHNRLVLNAKCAEKYPVAQFDYKHWEMQQPVAFMLNLADNLAAAYDNIVISTALQSPQLFMLMLRAAGTSPEDIVLIIAETPNGARWLSAKDFPNYLRSIAIDFDKAAAHQAISLWNQRQLAQNIPFCGYWPYHAGSD